MLPVLTITVDVVADDGQWRAIRVRAHAVGHHGCLANVDALAVGVADPDGI
jgi:hypothetical protein